MKNIIEMGQDFPKTEENYIVNYLGIYPWYSDILN